MISIFVFSLSFLIATSFLAPKAEANPRYASFVMDAETGLVLHQRHADKPLHPASLTKIMTLFMTFEALKDGRLRLNDRIRISNHAAGMVPSKLGLPAGSSIRVRDAIYALVTKSANDVAAALGEHLGGSEENFARMMTARARSLGMSSTTFRNASGLHDRRQISTARDMATLARITINRFPSYYKYFSRIHFSYNGKSYRNHNRLMGQYEGMDGMKTGYISASGFNLVASAVRNDQRIIGVVFGGRTAASRNNHMASLLDKGFNRLYEIRIANAQIPVPTRKPATLLAYNTIKNMMPTSAPETRLVQAEQKETDTGRWSFIKAGFKPGAFDELFGEGDYDPGARSRITTGLMAISAHRGLDPQTEPQKQQNPPVHNTGFQPEEKWAIQVGAFKNRSASDKALNLAKQVLPNHYAALARPVVAPLRTSEGLVFRARLTGYSQVQAERACRYLNDCLPIPVR